MKKGLISLVLVIIIVALLGVSGFLVYNAVIAQNQEVKNPVLTLNVENYGDVKIELYPEYAPNTVADIIALANNGYYTDKIFYGMDDVAVYVGRGLTGESDNPTISDIDKSVEAGSDADYTYEINGEFVANNFKQNTLKHEKGMVSLMRADYTQQIGSLTSQSYNSGSSQFTIIMNDEASKLNGLYAVFGKVIEGMDIVEKIYALDIKTEENEDGTTSATEDSIQPFDNAPVITSASVETYGADYGLPETHEAFDYSAYLQQLMTQYYSSQQ